jgi:hypothetical protein
VSLNKSPSPCRDGEMAGQGGTEVEGLESKVAKTEEPIQAIE